MPVNSGIKRFVKLIMPGSCHLARANQEDIKWTYQHLTMQPSLVRLPAKS